MNPATTRTTPNRADRVCGRSDLLFLALLPLAAVSLDDANACLAKDVGEVAACLEQSVARGPLLLQVSHGRVRRSARFNGNVCDADSALFDATRCHELALGVKDPRHLLEPVQEVASIGLVTRGAAKCVKTFHALSVKEAEQLQPSLKACLVSTWAAKMYQSLATAPCAQKSPDKADLVVLPGYTAVECNWPIYGGGDCMNRRDGLVNFARAGSTCRDEDTLQAYREIQKAWGKQVVVLENSPNPNGNKYDLPDDSVYAEPTMSWAFVGADSLHYRFGTDISLPPGPSLRCQLSAPSSVSAHSFGEPLEKKAYLASFKGGLSMHPFRATARDALHDGKRIVIADSADGAWDFDRLLFSSVFSLILRGDAIMTTRINEAICSGGIPVLITDSWIPPFNETVPFETFGLIHDELEVGSLKARLEKVSNEERNELRKKAKMVCESNFQTIDAHAASLAQAISQITKAVDAAG